MTAQNIYPWWRIMLYLAYGLWPSGYSRTASWAIISEHHGVPWGYKQLRSTLFDCRQRGKGMLRARLVQTALRGQTRLSSPIAVNDFWNSTLYRLIKWFRILRNLLLFFFSFGTILFILFFSASAIALANLRNRNSFSHQTSHTRGPLTLVVHLIFFELIRITILDLEPNPCFQIFLNTFETTNRIFNCNISKRRSGQELPFIFFELRALTCLWGRYDPKTENFTLFYIYLLYIHSHSRTFYVRV